MPLQHQSRRFGTLNCHVIDDLPAGTRPKLGFVLCHGYGAPGTDLLPLAQVLLQENPQLEQQIQFLFPEAPLSLEEIGLPGGRAWWPLNIRQLQLQLQANRIDEIRGACPPGLVEARDSAVAAIDAWRQAAGLNWSQVVIGGFSQGAMLTMEIIAHMPEAPAGMVLLSGTLIREGEWQRGLARRAGLPVLQTHGQYDVVLPFGAALWLKDLLTQAGCQLQFIPFPGGHEIPWEVLEALSEFLAQRLP